MTGELLPHPGTGELFPSPVPPGTGWPGDPATDQTPVARWNYVCGGVHEMVGDDDCDYDDGPYYAPKRWDKCPYHVKLHVSQMVSSSVTPPCECNDGTNR